MDEEESDFLLGPSEGEPLFSIQAPASPIHEPLQYPKAYNPYQAIKNLPQSKQLSYGHLFFNSKSFTGLSHFFEVNSKDEAEEFIEEIQGTVFEPDWYENALGLKDLFDPQSQELSEEYARKITSLKEKVDQIHNNTFNSISINKTVSQPFYDHLENFLYLSAEVHFLKGFEEDWLGFVAQIKKLSGTGPQLITAIFEFWMKNFKSFVQEIWKYSEKFTLSFLKKNKDAERESQSSGMQSSHASDKADSDKRRPWKHSQLEILHKLIESGSAMQTNLSKVAQELSRSPASISSKIQKIIKNKRRSVNPDFVEGDNMTLADKIVQVLKIYPQGLSRETVVERINEHYEMGYDQGWTKSVAQILSSKPEFVRIKGTFGLLGHHEFDLNKKTFRDKVVNCLLRCPSGRADLRKLVEVYVGLYERVEGISILSEERIRAIEASISKSLCRYDIFDKSHSKTVYKLRSFCCRKELEVEIESFLA